MKSFIPKVVSISLSLVILFLSSGFTMSSHYCGGMHIKSQLNIGKSDVSCGMKLHQPSKSLNGIYFTKVCCLNIYEYFELEDNPLTSFEIEVPPLNSIAILPITELSICEFTYKRNYYFLGFLPPPLEQDLIILFQSFLI